MHTPQPTSEPVTVTKAMRCGYCPEQATTWMEWKTIGRPKGAPVCDACKTKRDRPDNFGDHPVFRPIVLAGSPAADIEARWRTLTMAAPVLDQDTAARLDQLLADFPGTDHDRPRHALRLLAAAVQALGDAGLTDNDHLLGLVEHLLGR